MSEFEDTILSNVDDMYIDNHFTISKSDSELLIIETDMILGVVLSTVESDYKNIGMETADDGVIIYKDTQKIEPYINYYTYIYNIDRIDRFKEALHSNINDNNLNTGEIVSVIRTTSVVFGAYENEDTIEDNIELAEVIYENDIHNIIDIIDTIEKYREE